MNLRIVAELLKNRPPVCWKRFSKRAWYLECFQPSGIWNQSCKWFLVTWAGIRLLCFTVGAWRKARGQLYCLVIRIKH